MVLFAVGAAAGYGALQSHDVSVHLRASGRPPMRDDAYRGVARGLNDAEQAWVVSTSSRAVNRRRFYGAQFELTPVAIYVANFPLTRKVLASFEDGVPLICHVDRRSSFDQARRSLEEIAVRSGFEIEAISVSESLVIIRHRKDDP